MPIHVLNAFAMLSCCGARFLQLLLPLTALGALSPCLGQSSAPQQRPRQDGEGRPRPYLSWLSFSRGIRFGNECSYCGWKPLQYAARLACLRHSNVSILFECALHSLPFSQKGKSSMINKYKAVIALTLQVAKLHFDLQIETCCTNNF